VGASEAAMRRVMSDSMYATPRTIAEALSLAAAGDGTLLAGGTDIYPTQQGRPLDGSLIDLTAVSELRGIATTGEGIRIGALTTWSEVAAADLGSGCRSLQQAAVQVGGPQIQNVGTVAGNLCNASPAADGVPPLLTLDAMVEVASLEGRRNLPIDEFLVGYRATALQEGELVTAVVIPSSSTVGRSAFLKLGSRRYLVISIAMVAVRIVCDAAGSIEQARIAVGACSPVAQRLVGLEAEAIGLTPSAAAAAVDARHLDALDPIDDPRATAAYRLDVAATLVARALAACEGGS
jgi:CO/xanthine dehydrogenase FAD-binding subunit